MMILHVVCKGFGCSESAMPAQPVRVTGGIQVLKMFVVVGQSQARGKIRGKGHHAALPLQMGMPHH